MKKIPPLCVFTFILCTLTTFSLSAESSSSKWINNGATACEKFLTPEVVSAILPNPAGPAQKIDEQSCHSGSIYISLSVKNLNEFRLEIPRIALTHAMTGVGDAAYWNQAGAVAAVKGPDRKCEISVLGASSVAKIHDAELGQKLGEVCNKLFALP